MKRAGQEPESRSGCPEPETESASLPASRPAADETRSGNGGGKNPGQERPRDSGNRGGIIQPY